MKKILLGFLIIMSVVFLVACSVNGKKVSIKFDSYDNINPIVAEPGEKISAPNIIPTKKGYIFTGWFYKDKPYIFNKMPNEDITLIANFKSTAEKYYQASSLPKMFINIKNNVDLELINREEYVDSQITIHGVSDKDNLIALTSEFKGRGHGSWTDSGPKKGYRLKFSSKQSLFGEPASRHWVLLAGANFYDTTLSKNASAFKMARDVFTYIGYTTSTNWVELYINGEYRGIYIVAEHVRVDKDRVNIKPEYGVLDTGYLLEYDAYGKEEGPEGIYYFSVNGYKYPIVVKGPDPDNYKDEGLTTTQFKEQVSFIKDYTTKTLEAALNKNLELFESYADINSFIDMYLLHELYKNTDTGWSSFYMYKKPGDKLYAGPAWDFDATAGSNRGDQTPYGFFVSDTILQTSDFTASELYISLMEIPKFREKVATRWQEVSAKVKSFVNNFLSDDFINAHCITFGRNFERWSEGGWNYGKYNSIEEAALMWGESIRTLRQWLIDRSNWLDSAL